MGTKTKKDKNAPKKARGAYTFFMVDKSAEIKSKLPEGEKVEGLMKKVAEAWKTVSAEDKKKYEDMATADKERSKTEASAYKLKKAAEAKEEANKSSSGPSGSDSSSGSGSDSDSSSSGSGGGSD